jgi:hypothetical protein
MLKFRCPVGYAKGGRFFLGKAVSGLYAVKNSGKASQAFISLYKPV